MQCVLRSLCTFHLLDPSYQAEEKNSALETGSQFTPSSTVKMDVRISLINPKPFSLYPNVLCVFQLENLMYYTENNHNKVVLRDFYLSRFENGSITEPCGTPEYLGTNINQHMIAGYDSGYLNMFSVYLHGCVFLSLQHQRWWLDIGMEDQWIAGPLGSSCTCCKLTLYAIERTDCHYKPCFPMSRIQSPVLQSNCQTL